MHKVYGSSRSPRGERGAWIEISLPRPPFRRPRSLPSRGVWIEMGSSCPGRSFWLICAPFRLSRGAALSGYPDGRAVPQPVGQGFPAASKAPAPKIWLNAAFCRPAACHFWEEAPDSGTGPAAERGAAAGCRRPKPAESLSSAPPSSRARRKSI